MLDLDVAGDGARHRGRDRDRRARRRGSSSSRSTRRTSGSASSSAGRTRSSPRTTPRSGSTACSSHVPAGVELEQPLYVRVVNAIEGGSLFWRLLVVAEEGARFTLIEEYSSASPDLHGYIERASPSSSSSRARSSSTSRSRTSRARRGTSPRTTRASSATPSSTGSPAASARKKGKVRIQNDLAGPGATSRVTGAYFADGDAAPRLRHLPGAHGAEHDVGLRLQGRAARHVDGGLARDDPRREGRAEDERVPGEPQPDALADDARGADPGPRDPRQRRPLHARRDRRPRRPRAALLPDVPRALARARPSA